MCPGASQISILVGVACVLAMEEASWRRRRTERTRSNASRHVGTALVSGESDAKDLRTPLASSDSRDRWTRRKPLLGWSPTAANWLISSTGDVLVVPVRHLLAVEAGTRTRPRASFTVGYNSVR